MKTRNSFVSNSSSTSFTIYGWKEDLSEGTIEKLEKEFNTKYELDPEYPRDSISDFLYSCSLDVGISDFTDEVCVWGKSYVGSYNDSIEVLDLERMQEILSEMRDLAQKLDLEEPTFFLVGEIQ